MKQESPCSASFATAASISIHTPRASVMCEAHYTPTLRSFNSCVKCPYSEPSRAAQPVALRLLESSPRMVMRRSVVLTAVLALTIAAWSAGVKAVLLAESISEEVHRATVLANLSPRPQATIVYDRYDRPAFTFFVEQRIAVPLDRVSHNMIDALLAVEDRRFFSHHGMDPVRIAGAAWRNVRAGRIVEGPRRVTRALAR